MAKTMRKKAMAFILALAMVVCIMPPATASATSQNTAPSFTAGATNTLAAEENDPAEDIKSLLHVSDSDSGQTLTWTEHTAPSNGALTITDTAAGSGSTDITPGGTITYTPTADYSGSDSFVIQVSDGTDTDTISVSVTIVGATPDTVYVDDDYTETSCGGHTWGFDAFASIRSGIDATAVGGTVRVAAGSYSEAGEIQITKALTIMGQNYWDGDNTYHEDTFVSVTPPSDTTHCDTIFWVHGCTDVYISGFTLDRSAEIGGVETPTSQTGIVFTGGCDFDSSRVSNCKVTGERLIPDTDNCYSAIQLIQVDDVIIENNIVEGVVNTSEYAATDFYDGGIGEIGGCEDIVIRGNYVDGLGGTTTPKGGCGIACVMAGEVTIENNVLTGCRYGIYENQVDLTILGNEVYGNDIGVQCGAWTMELHENFIHDNTISVSCGYTEAEKVNAERNHWGTTETSAIEAGFDGNVDYFPYYIDSAMTTLCNDTVYVNPAYTTAEACAADGHTLGVDAFATIEDGVDGVGADGTVYISAGTYSVSSTIIIGKNMTIEGPAVAENGQPTAIFDGGVTWNGSTPDTASGKRIFLVNGGNVTFRNVTLQNGYSTDGGAALIESGYTLNASCCLFKGNVASASYGSAVAANGSFIANDCAFDGNSFTGTGYGAAVAAAGSSTAHVELYCCNFTDNTSSGDVAGVLFNGGADDTSGGIVQNCTFTGNSGGAGSGAIYADDFPNGVTVTDSTFTGNSAKDGGAIYTSADAPITIAHCIYDGNTATGGNGGGATYHSGLATITDCVYINNSTVSSARGAGAIMFSTSAANGSVSGTYFSGNTASGTGSIIYTDSADVDISGNYWGGSAPTIVTGTTENGSGTEGADTCQVYVRNDGSSYFGSVILDTYCKRATPITNSAYYTLSHMAYPGDSTAPTMTSVGPAEGAITLGNGESLVLMITAHDDIELYELEIDHSMESALPEFSVYADSENPYGTAQDKAAFEAQGVSVTYGGGVWTINFGDTVTEALVANGGIDFYMVLKDTVGNAWGSMYSVTDENTFSYTTTRVLTPILSSKTTTGITLTRVTGYEYIIVSDGASLSTGTWQDSNVFAGLSAGTSYDAYQRVKETATHGASAVSAKLDVTTDSAGGGEGSSDSSGGEVVEPQTPTGAEVIVNGESQTAGESTTTTNSDGETVTTVTVDTDRLNDILEDEGNGATVVIPIAGDSDVAAGVLTGEMVRNMENREATLVVQTDSATYTVPASEININAVSEQLGMDVSLSDITVKVEVAEPSAETVAIVENAAEDGGMSIVAPAVDFTITCEYGGRTVEVSTFASYVERLIAIPSGVDPNKITTGVVVRPNGTTYHVPTQVVEIDGVYYARINSLTNSTYTVVWHPMEFTDVTNHWAKDVINDMGSRMVVSGIGGTNYAPDREITRAEFAVIVVRALGLVPGTGENSFSDVSTADWFCGYMETASSYGIISGYGNGMFGPSDKITREQAITMIARAMKITGLKVSLTDSEISELMDKLTDGASASDYAKGSIAACLKTGVVSGRGDGTVAPRAFITRAEVAVIVQRLLRKSELI